MTDRELLEAAAKAAGMATDDPDPKRLGYWQHGGRHGAELWNPLEDDGDALRLAVKLNLSIRFDTCSRGAAVDVGGEWDYAPAGAQETYERDAGAAATRRAIVRAAAETGKALA